MVCRHRVDAFQMVARRRARQIRHQAKDKRIATPRRDQQARLSDRQKDAPGSEYAKRPAIHQRRGRRGRRGAVLLLNVVQEQDVHTGLVRKTTLPRFADQSQAQKFYKRATQNSERNLSLGPSHARLSLSMLLFCLLFSCLLLVYFLFCLLA